MGQKSVRKLLAELVENGVNLTQVAYHLGYSYAGVQRWYKLDSKIKPPVYKELLALLERAKKGEEL